MRPSLEDLIDSALARHVSGRVVWVALSGGLDSSLLLSVAAPLARQRGVDLRAIHVNHDLQAAAGDFESHCRELCDSLAVSLVVASVTVSPAGQGIEAAARDARYQAFSRHLSTGDRLWLAQHADDQAETLLLATLRGSGVRGLAGMPVVRQWRGLAVERPWLGLARSELAREAARRGVAWCEDPTNAEVRFDRNYLRHRVLAPLRQRWPGAAEALARSAGHLQETDELLGQLAEIDLAEAGGDPGCLRLSTLRGLVSSRRRLLIRHALKRLDLPAPPAARLVELERQLTTAAADRLPSLVWAGGEARLWRNHLYLLAPQSPIDLSWQTTWDGVSPLETPWGQYYWVLQPARGGTTTSLRVGLRQGGERLCLAGRGRRDLKRLLQEAGVPPWQRDRLPLVWFGDELVAALGVASAQGWCQTR
ncbi:tRNA lysidine(34) synthetase TilS [Salinicola halophyticus]|uniref:tRNA lysidine(34) synthetase TilS n=1 Tax=Salinicola halophyticus TaxID=1808881 RepID=UPI000DA15C78|nr:tRNA lysidine(34) synthetase TilS [Salinicola halophyticus]